MRPAALSRGPRRKPTSEALIGGVTRATSIRARRPAERVSASASSPSLAITRFSPRSGTMSATVPRQVTRRSGAGGTGRRQRSATAVASLNASPAPERWGKG